MKEKLMAKKSSEKYNVLKSVPVVLEEAFKGEVPEQKATWDNKKGVQHPFDFSTMQKIYEKYGVITGAVDKYVDFIIGPGFYLMTENKKVETILDNFLQDQNFDTILRKWVKQALIKGSSPMEVNIDKKRVAGLKVLNADTIHIVRDSKGEVLEYIQIIMQKGAMAKEIHFKPEEIIMLQFNVPDDSAYGLGIVYPCLGIINNLLGCEKDMHMLIKRKANSPIHIQLGNYDKDDLPTDEDLTNFGQKLEYLTNKQEWATGPNVNMKVLDFGNIGAKFEVVLAHDTESLFYALQIPAVLMGMANVAEGLANTQMDAWMRRVQSFQAEIEKLIETELFDRILSYQGLKEHVEFEWGAPSNSETNQRITQISTLLTNVMIGPELRSALEEELAYLMKLNVDVDPDKERQAEETEPLPKVPGQETIYEGELIFA